jgi:hypothetical protein
MNKKEADAPRGDPSLTNRSRWGVDDDRGALNFITDAARARGVTEATTGRGVSLAHPVGGHGLPRCPADRGDGQPEFIVRLPRRNRDARGTARPRAGWQARRKPRGDRGRSRGCRAAPGLASRVRRRPRRARGMSSPPTTPSSPRVFTVAMTLLCLRHGGPRLARRSLLALVLCLVVIHVPSWIGTGVYVVVRCLASLLADPGLVDPARLAHRRDLLDRGFGDRSGLVVGPVDQAAR